MNLQMRLEEESEKYIKEILNGKMIEKLSWSEGGVFYLYADKKEKEQCLFVTSLKQEQLHLKKYYYQIVEESKNNDSEIIQCKKIQCKEVFYDKELCGCYIFITTEKVRPMIQLILDGKFCDEKDSENKRKIKLLVAMRQACEHVMQVEEKYPFINLFINNEELCIDTDGNVKLLLFDMIKNQIEIKNYHNELVLLAKQMSKGLSVDIEELPIGDSVYELSQIYKKESDQLFNIEKESVKKFVKYQKLANIGNAAAQRNLGYMYETGKGVPRDYKKAFIWYERSAKNNNSQALNNLAHMYQKGYGVKKDYEKAIKCLLQSAKMKDDIAQFNLGIAFQMGKGVEKDMKQALYWYKKSMKNGNKEAKRMYERVLYLQKSRRNRG